MLTEDQERKILKYIDSFESTVYIDWRSYFCQSREPLDLVNFKEHKNILNGLKYVNNENKKDNEKKANKRHDWPTNLKPYKLVYHVDEGPFGDYTTITLIAKDEISGKFCDYDIGWSQYIETVEKYLEHNPKYRRIEEYRKK